MGQAKNRGTFEERKQRAIDEGRKKVKKAYSSGEGFVYFIGQVMLHAKRYYGRK